MFLVKQEQHHPPASSSSSSSSSINSNPMESNSFHIDAVSSSSSPYQHREYTTTPHQFWSLPPYVTS